MKGRTEIINFLARKIKANAYLEIGLGGGENFAAIECSKKTSVDPRKNATYKMTSREFFEINKESFDLIFVDGLHEANQTEEDILNSLNVLNSGGFIVCHDMHPEKEIEQIYPRDRSREEKSKKTGWTGDCWKAWVKIRSENPNLKMFIVDDDCGCGVITEGKQDLIDISNLDLTWENFCKYKKEWLNLIPKKDFQTALETNI